MKTKYTFIQAPDGVIHRSISPGAWGEEYKRLTQREGKKLFRIQQIEALKSEIPENGKIYGFIRHVSSSGMSRDIDFYIVDNLGNLKRITWVMGIILDLSTSKNGGLVVKGCGMDMVYATVDDLRHYLGYNKLNHETI